VLEAYTRLHLIHPSTEVKAALRYNIEMFDKYIIDKNTFHLRMFFDKQWADHSPGVTYGHDIEASWLIAKALESLGDADYAKKIMPTLIRIAEVTLQEGIGEHHHVLDAFDYASKTISPDIVWWVQAEALVGFLFAHIETKDKKYLSAAEAIWHFIKQYQIDKKDGEWFWLSTLDAPRAEPYYKVGFWKCPYHNGRAMIEASHYLDLLN
jgi:cellobiose epimerase